MSDGPSISISKTDPILTEPKAVALPTPPDAYAILANALEHTSSLARPQMSPVGDILVRKGYLRKYQLEFLLDLQEAYRRISREYKIGDLLLSHRVVSKQQLKEALEIQKEAPSETVTKLIGHFRDQMSHIGKILAGNKED